MRREQHTKPHSNPQPGHTACSYFYTPAFQYLIPTIPSTQNNILKSLDRLNNFSWFFFPEGFLLYTPGKHGLLHSARPLAASHPPGIPPVHTGRGFSSHLCGLHSLTHRSCHAITALTLHKAVVKNEMLSLFFLCPLSSFTQLLQCIGFQSSPLPSPFWKVISVQKGQHTQISWTMQDLFYCLLQH